MLFAATGSKVKTMIDWLIDGKRISYLTLLLDMIRKKKWLIMTSIQGKRVPRGCSSGAICILDTQARCLLELKMLNTLFLSLRLQQTLREKLVELQTLTVQEKRLTRGEVFCVLRPQRFLSLPLPPPTHTTPPPSLHPFSSPSAEKSEKPDALLKATCEGVSLLMGLLLLPPFLSGYQQAGAELRGGQCRVGGII